MKLSRAVNNALKGSVRVAQAGQAAPAATAQPSQSTPSTNSSQRLRKDIKFNKLSSWPDLGAFHPRLDVPQGEDPLKAGLPTEAEVLEEERQKAIKRMYEGDPLHELSKSLPYSLQHLRSLTEFTFPLITKRVMQQTSKGKIMSKYALVVVGNGRGMVGLGEGKGDSNGDAIRKATIQAVRDMDYVDRFQDRTIYGELKSKVGSSIVELRSRPAGFGLRCNPFVHQVAKAAGIEDLSAKCRRSKNAMQVVKATLKALHGGAQPQLMSRSGIVKVPRLEKGAGMKSVDELGMERGRQMVYLRKQVY
ncbi:hypothetical protein E3P99_00427 [Wallemia hederae]|uniref:Small ribosomal subunit protein uS5m n=1 Tax=Wallemia hederae TaxID=1540922 RepID=A0A4T0FVZ1_9BASI|nr:hypothetical protein E3P99_00427 [Wallemia hederae]